MALIEPIKIEGLADFSRNLRKLNNDLPKALRIAHNEGAQIIVDWAVPKIPKNTGRAAKSVKAKSTRTESRVVGGSTRAPYYPWLDFGGRVGRKRSVQRPFIKGGRYIYEGYSQNTEQIRERLEQALLRVAAEAGVEVDG
jgi:hypothetical protein